MRNKYKSPNMRPGFIAALGLLVVVAIIMILISIQVRTFFGTPSRSVFDPPREKPPWTQSEKERLVPADKIIELPQPPKPTLDQPVRINAPVTREESERGTVRITIQPNGRVAGQWQCAYAYDETRYSYQADFAGNIDVSKTYIDGEGKDKSRLYFYTMGDYRQYRAGEDQVPRVSEEGTIYVTGYLRPDYSAHGIITLRWTEHAHSEYQFAMPAPQ